MHYTTGFDREEIIDLCIRINSVERGADDPRWPPCLGLFKSVTVTLTYMRHNRTQAEIGESFGVSQPTVSRAISAIVPLVPQAVSEFVPTADDLDPRITSQPSRSQAARRPATQRHPGPSRNAAGPRQAGTQNLLMAANLAGAVTAACRTGPGDPGPATDMTGRRPTTGSADVRARP